MKSNHRKVSLSALNTDRLSLSLAVEIIFDPRTNQIQTDRNHIPNAPSIAIFESLRTAHRAIAIHRSVVMHSEVRSEQCACANSDLLCRPCFSSTHTLSTSQSLCSPPTPKTDTAANGGHPMFGNADFIIADLATRTYHRQLQRSSRSSPTELSDTNGTNNAFAVTNRPLKLVVGVLLISLVSTKPFEPT